MRTIVQPTPDVVASLAASLVLARVRQLPELVLGLATGATMVPVYRELVRRQHVEGVSFARVRLFALDEYRGVATTHPGSCRGFLETHLLGRLDVVPANVHLLNGLTSDVAAECRRYEAAILAAGGIDVQLLGIGGNGHIGFNEPGSRFDSRTRLVTLSERTRQANAPQWDGRIDDVPAEALTLGVGTILDARTCLLLAFGSGKAAAIAAAVEGPRTVEVPASALQAHPDAVVMVDAAAASGLRTVT